MAIRSFLLAILFDFVKILVLCADLHGSHHDLVQLRDPWCFNRLFDDDVRQRRNPLQEPLVVALREQYLNEVGDPVQILLMVLVVDLITDGTLLLQQFLVVSIF